MARRPRCIFVPQMRATGFVLFFLFNFSGLLMAQGGELENAEHPFIKSFTLTVQDGTVQVDWVMQGGSSCDGNEVLRSTNGVDFQRVHRLNGICGDPIVDVPFSWRDGTVPEYNTVYYRIGLGIDGFSSVKSVDLIQFPGRSHHFFPSPMSGHATLLLNVQNSTQVDLVIMDALGKVVLERNGLTGREHQTELPYAAPGIHTYIAIADGRRFTGRFVKE